MACASSALTDRLEDVFQETVKKFAAITEFKKFARSRFGLCLDQSDIQNIDENNDGSEDKKMAMLGLWRQKNGTGATISRIHYLVESYLRGDNPENRLEDVFQETFKAFASIAEFKKFARSRFGLCLDQSDIQNIDENNDGSEDKKIAMLELWRQKNGAGATISRIHYLVESYSRGGNPEIRLKDVFQDEIIKAFASITEFKKFARSKNGLCLNESDIQNIDEDEDNSEDKKMAMLEMWRQKNGADATIPRIRYLVERYPKGDNPENYRRLSEMFGLFKDKPLCKRGHVYLGEQISSLLGSIPRAIKMLPYDDKSLREAGILTKLGHHENVVSVIHADKLHGSFPEYIYIVMELFSSKHLRDLLEECKQTKTVLDDKTLTSLATQILKAIVHIHEKKVIHRDLKPENVLISDDNKHVKVTDLGISKVINEGDYTNNTDFEVGTEGYKAAETYNNNQLSNKSDQFSLGIILAELFSKGHHPFGNNPDLWKHYIKTNQIVDLDHIDQESVKNLIKQLLLFEPERRPSAKEALNSFMKLVQSQNAAFDEPSAEKETRSEQSVHENAVASKKVSDEPCTEKETPDDRRKLDLRENFRALDVQKKAPSTSNETKVRKFDSKNLVEQKRAHTKISPVTGNEGQIPESDEMQATALSAQPVKANAIIIFDERIDHMHSFKPSLREWNKMQAFYDVGRTVVLDQYIYNMYQQNVSRLKYLDAAAKWQSVADMRENRGRRPSTVAFEGSIYVCGSTRTTSRTVDRYDVSENAWNLSPQMNIARENPCVVASEDHIYAIGGRDEHGVNRISAERFDGKKWTMIEKAPIVPSFASAVVLDRKIYVSDGQRVQCYNIQTSSWEPLDLSSTWPFGNTTKILNVDNELYIIGRTRNGKYAIYLLDLGAEQLTLTGTVIDKMFTLHQCVAVKL